MKSKSEPSLKFNMPDFAKKLSEVIGNRSLRSVASDTGLRDATISKWVKGEAIPSASKVLKLAEALRISPAWLLWGEGDQADFKHIWETVSGEDNELFGFFNTRAYASDKINKRIEDSIASFNLGEVSKKVGASENALRRYQWNSERKGHLRPSIEMIEKLAAALGVSPLWLLTGIKKGQAEEEETDITEAMEGQDEDHTERFWSKLNQRQKAEHVEFALKQMNQTQLLSYVRYKAPRGVETEESTPVAFSESFLESLNVEGDSIKLLTVEDGLMQPTLNKGDVVLVDTSNRTPTKPGVYALQLEDALIVGRIQPTGGDGFLLSRDDPSWPDTTLKTASVEIHGRVIWAGKKL